MDVRRLLETDDRSGFRCPSGSLQRFFREIAGQSQFRRYTGVTYVAVTEGGEIVGYVTVAMGEVKTADLPPSRRRGLPRHAVPVLRLARLATHSDYLGQGIGKLLTRFVLSLALVESKAVGCLGVLVDPKNDAVGFYAKLGFIALEATQGQSPAGPGVPPMFLAIETIAKASG